MKTNATKVGLNQISNRLSILTGLIPYYWLNSTIESFKVYCKSSSCDQFLGRYNLHLIVFLVMSDKIRIKYITTRVATIQIVTPDLIISVTRFSGGVHVSIVTGSVKISKY